MNIGDKTSAYLIIDVLVYARPFEIATAPIYQVEITGWLLIAIGGSIILSGIRARSPTDPAPMTYNRFHVLVSAQYT